MLWCEICEILIPEEEMHFHIERYHQPQEETD